MKRRETRLAIVQYAGDFLEASQRLNAGGAETYRGQRYTVEFVEKLAGRLKSVTTITGLTSSPYESLLPSGAIAVGAGFKDRVEGSKIVRLLAEADPDIIVLRTPLREVLIWAALHRRRTLLLLADSFDSRSIKNRISAFILAIFTRLPNIDWVANHGIRSAEQLVKLGVPARKVLAWDYPAFDTPSERPSKIRAKAPCKIMYVGLMIREKGVDCLIEAVRNLVADGHLVQLDLVGKLDDGRLAHLISSAGLQDSVRQVGTVANAQILPMMHDADIVVVPSLHEYSEGLPLTIYEALCSRTPLIVSDHPMFIGNIENDKTGIIVSAGNAENLASAIKRLINDEDLYKRLSEQSLPAWNRLQIPLKWGNLIDDWIENSPASRARLEQMSLSARGLFNVSDADA
ncbi:glycosyltransferase family 4 protein [Methylobacterium sp. CM6247]